MTPSDEDLREIEELNAQFQAALMTARLLAKALKRTPWWHFVARWQLIQRIGELEDTASLARQEAEIITRDWERS